MAGGFEALYFQDFTTTSSITVTHNLDRVICAVRVIIGNTVRNDLVSKIVPSVSDPRNVIIVTLNSSNSGVIQIIDSDYIWNTLPTPEGASVLENNISGSTFSGSFTGSFSGDVVGGNISPSESGSHDLGSLTKPWKSLYVTNESIFFVSGGVAIAELTVDESGMMAVTGSTAFGSLSSDTHVFTGSVDVSGALNVTGDIDSGGTFSGSFSGDGSAITNAQVSGSNLLWVDISGSDTTGTRERFDKPYASIGGALSSASAGDAIIVRPGTYEETITMVDGVSVTGMDRDRCILKNYSGGYTVTMADNCAFEHMSIDISGSSGVSFTGTTGGTSAIRHARITSVGGNAGGIGITGTPAPSQNWVTCDHVDVLGSGLSSAFINNSAGTVNLRDCFGYGLVGFQASSTSTTRTQDCRFSGYIGIYITDSTSTMYVDQSTRWSSLTNAAGGTLASDITHLLVATGNNNEIQISSGSLLSSSANLTFDGDIMVVTGTLSIDGNADATGDIDNAGTYNGIQHYTSSAADPTTPAPSDGDRYYNTALDMEMRYDSTRSKWLSVETSVMEFGRNGNTGGGSYYRGPGNRAYSSASGRTAEFNGTIVSVSYTRTDTDSATFEVTANGTGIATLASSAAAGKDVTLNGNFTADQILAVKNQTGSNTTRNVLGWIRVKWRV